MSKQRKIPTHWYNVAADTPNAPLPPLNPATKEPIGPEALAPLSFARAEGIIPAPEANHAVASAIREAKQAREAGEAGVILFKLSQAEIDAAVAKIDTPEIPAAG